MKILDTVKKLPCHPKNRGGTRRKDQIKYLCFHYTGNAGDRAVNNAKYYRNTVVQASAHYFVDDEDVYQSVEDLEIAWAVGGKKWTDCPRTGGGSLYGVVTNGNSISIEMCGTFGNGERRASEATLQRAAELGRELMEKYQIPVERVVRHFDVTGKHCPAYMMDHGAWEAFRGRIAAGSRNDDPEETDGRAEVVPPRTEAGMDYPTEEEREMKLYQYVKDMPSWAQQAATRAINAGVVRMDAGGAVSVWECNLQPLVWMDRVGLLEKPAIEGR